MCHVIPVTALQSIGMSNFTNEKTEVKSYTVYGRTRSQRKVFSVQHPPSPGETPSVQGHTDHREGGR